MADKKRIYEPKAKVAPPKKQPVKAAPLKPTIVDRIPPGWYPSEESSPPPRPVDQDSGPIPQYRLFSIPDPSGKKGKRMEILVKSLPPQYPGVQPIPNVTHPPYKATWTPKSGTWKTPPLPMGKEASVEMPNKATPKTSAPKAAYHPPLAAPKPTPVHPLYAAAAAAVSKLTSAARKKL